MPKCRSKLSVREVNEQNLYRRTHLWYVACSKVDPEKVREEYRHETFSIMRAKGLTNDERERLRALVSDEQKRRYKVAKKLESHAGGGL